MSRAVTERDLRMPEFRDAKPEDLEFRSDGKIVRKDRWKTGIYNIQQIVLPDTSEFEIDDLVQRVRELKEHPLLLVQLGEVNQHETQSAARGIDWICDVIRQVSELPDRTSPDGQPEMMLVTADELMGILKNATQRDC